MSVRIACLVTVLATAAGCAGPSALGSAASQQGLPATVELQGTPYHAQTDHHCGPAALAMLLGASGRDTEPARLADEIFLPGREGTLQVEIAAALRARKLMAYPVERSLEALLAELAAGRPVLVLQRLGLGDTGPWHYAVVIGYDAQRGTVVLRSGKTPRLVMRAAAFDYTWAASGRWGLLALEPGELPARPDSIAYVRAAAELEAVGAGDAALAAYRSATARWPAESLPWLGIGNVAASRGDWVAAEQAYRTALQIDPSSAAAMHNHAEAVARLADRSADEGA